MKKTTSIISAIALIATLAACSNTGEVTQTTQTEAGHRTSVATATDTPTADTPTEISLYPPRNCVDEARRNWGSSDSDTIAFMLDNFSDLGRQEVERQLGTPLSVLSGVAVEMRAAEHWHGAITQNTSINYLFKVTENLTGGYDVPEYLVVTSNWGGIFEIGKEYLISPARNFSTLFDSHTISNLGQVISRDLVPESDIELFRRAGVERGAVVNSGNGRHGAREISTLSRDFVSSVDLVATLRIIESTPDSHTDGIFDIHFEIVNILQGEEHREALENRGNRLRANFDVEVGGTYLAMYEHFGGSSFLPATRNGSFVSTRSPEFEQYRAAFEELATS
jgi:hypothetical protein